MKRLLPDLVFFALVWVATPAAHANPLSFGTTLTNLHAEDDRNVIEALKTVWQQTGMGVKGKLWRLWLPDPSDAIWPRAENWVNYGELYDTLEEAEHAASRGLSKRYGTVAISSKAISGVGSVPGWQGGTLLHEAVFVYGKEPPATLRTHSATSAGYYGATEMRKLNQSPKVEVELGGKRISCKPDFALSWVNHLEVKHLAADIEPVKAKAERRGEERRGKEQAKRPHRLYLRQRTVRMYIPQNAFALVGAK